MCSRYSSLLRLLRLKSDLTEAFRMGRVSRKKVCFILKTYSFRSVLRRRKRSQQRYAPSERHSRRGSEHARRRRSRLQRKRSVLALSILASTTKSKVGFSSPSLLASCTKCREVSIRHCFFVKQAPSETAESIASSPDSSSARAPIGKKGMYLSEENDEKPRELVDIRLSYRVRTTTTLGINSLL